MTDSVRLLGPRGWAALILASGAALSAPFLRNPGDTPPDEQPTAGTLPQVAATPSTWPDLHERSLTPPQAAANLTEQDWAELSRLQKISGASPRKVTGELPSTSGPSKLPAWADRGPRIDQVVKETLVTDSLPPLADAGVNPAHQNSANQNSAHQNSALEPFRPWMGDGLKSKADAPAIAESSANDFAMAQRDPDARWSNAPNSTHAEFSGATTSNGSLVRKFENKVAQWPDEIVAPPQFFEQSRQQALASRDATRPNVNWPSTAGSTQPLPAPGIGQIVNVPIRQSLGDVASQPGAQEQQTATAQINLPSVNLPSGNLPSGNVQNAAVMPPAFALQPTMQPTAPIQPSVTAPMISSQSGRPANRPLDPSIEATKPKSDTPRPKHFIQQPTKRA